MFINTNDHKQAARLFSFLMLGEEVAQFCATEQSKHTHNRGVKKFLKSQARQENFHRIVFSRGLSMLAPKGVGPDPIAPQMHDYTKLLQDAINRNDFAETLLGQQVILEGLGEIVLGRIDEGMKIRKFGFTKIRHLILHQEHAHHDFGLRKLDDEIQSLKKTNPLKIKQLSSRTDDYMELVETMMKNLQHLFDYFNHDSSQYLCCLQKKLPGFVHRENEAAV